MARAYHKGVAPRRKLGPTGRMDRQAVADPLGFKVKLLPMEAQAEIEVDGYTSVAERSGPEWRLWRITHTLGHKTMHFGILLRGYRYTGLGK